MWEKLKNLWKHRMKMEIKFLKHHEQWASHKRLAAYTYIFYIFWEPLYTYILI